MNHRIIKIKKIKRKKEKLKRIEKKTRERKHLLWQEISSSFLMKVDRMLITILITLFLTVD